jgi:phage-related protein
MTDKEIKWMGDSLETLKGFPEDVKDMFGHALRQAQRGLADSGESGPPIPL